MAHFAFKDNDLSTMLPPFWNIQIQGVCLFALFNNKVFLSCFVMISLHSGQCVRHCCAHVQVEMVISSQFPLPVNGQRPCKKTGWRLVGLTIWSLCTMFIMKVIIKLTWLADTGNTAGMGREPPPPQKKKKKKKHTCDYPINLLQNVSCSACSKIFFSLQAPSPPWTFECVWISSQTKYLSSLLLSFE